MSKSLSKQQEGFCQSYILHGNAAQAYRENYKCEKMATKTIWEEASKLLASPKVATRVKELQKNASDRHEGIQDRIIAEYSNIAFSNPADYFDWGPEGVTVKDSSELTREQMAAVAGASETITQFGGTIKINMNSKTKALDSLARIFGMNQDTLTVKHNREEIAQQAKEARQRLKAIGGKS